MFKTAALLLASAAALDNGLGRTPALGFNTWNKFACDISEDLIKETADAMVDSGLLAAGYEYLNLDDCWAASRDPDTNKIVVDADAFPSGMAALADYVRGKGLKLGIYSDAGYETCAGRPGSLHYEAEDAESYADWGIEYLKYDNCDAGRAKDGEGWVHPYPRYEAMRDALNATGAPILFSMCEWGLGDPAQWAGELANSWRVTQDIRNTWGSVSWIVERNAKNAAAAMPGAFNDMDMLEVGNGVLSDEEGRTHFALWAALKSPLIFGADARDMDAATLATLTNELALAINQDPRGEQATRRVKGLDAAGAGAGEVDLWAGALGVDNDACAVLAVNRGSAAANVTLPVAANTGVADDAAFEEAWSGAKGSLEGGEVAVELPGHGSWLARVSGGC